MPDDIDDLRETVAHMGLAISRLEADNKRTRETLASLAQLLLHLNRTAHTHGDTNEHTND